MKILHNPVTLDHRTRELVGARLIDAYESPERLKSILAALAPLYEITEVSTDLERASEAAAKVHTPEYLKHIETIFESWCDERMVEPDGCVLPECFPVIRLGGKKTRQPKDLAARVGYYAFDMSTGISRSTYSSAIASADLARRGAEELVAEALAAAADEPVSAEEEEAEVEEEDEEDEEEEEAGDGASDSDRQDAPLVFALCRPPGHHCQTDLMGGYCYLNNTAIAVRTLLDSLPDPDQQISILDLDFHHGNGTQSIFYHLRNPCYVSIHGEDEYPYFTGSPEETGEGEGEGYNLNLPLPCEMGDFKYYRPRLEEAVDKIKEVQTRWLVVSLGFDTFVNDPVGKFMLHREDYGAMGAIVGELNLPTLVVLEGGYVVEELGNNCVEFLRGLEGNRTKREVVLSIGVGVGGDTSASASTSEEDWEEVLEVSGEEL